MHIFTFRKTYPSVDITSCVTLEFEDLPTGDIICDKLWSMSTWLSGSNDSVRLESLKNSSRWELIPKDKTSQMWVIDNVHVEYRHVRSK